MVPQEEFESMMAEHRHVFQGMSFIAVDSINIDFDKPKAHVKAKFRFYLDKSSGSPGEVSADAEFDFKFSHDLYLLTRLVVDQFGIK